VVAAVHRGEPIEAAKGVRRVAIEAVRARGHVPTLEVRATHRSALDPFLKLASHRRRARHRDGAHPARARGRFSVCVSSQAGCALGCTFCATGRMGLSRNLETWEIVEQVRLVRGRSSPHGPSGCTAWSSRDGRAAGQRRAGHRGHPRDVRAVGHGHRRAQHDGVHLGPPHRDPAPRARAPQGASRSLHRQRPSRRAAEPHAIDAAHPLDDVLDAAEEHARVTGLAPMWAVTPLSGVNDTDDDARALAERLRRFESSAGVRPRLSVVPYNAIDVAGADPFQRATSPASWPPSPSTAYAPTFATAEAQTSPPPAGNWQVGARASRWRASSRRWRRSGPSAPCAAGFDDEEALRPSRAHAVHEGLAALVVAEGELLARRPVA